MSASRRKIVAGAAVALAIAVGAAALLRGQGPAYSPVGPYEYWRKWAVLGGVREVGEKDGWVYWIWFTVDARHRHRTRCAEFRGQRDASLRRYLDILADQDDADYLTPDRDAAVHLTGKQELSLSEWQRWWKANRGGFRFTEDIMMGFDAWLKRSGGNYWLCHDDYFDQFIERERERLGIR